MSNSLDLSTLESHLWEAANILRGPVDAADFKTYIFPLLFFKRISDVYDEEVAQALEESGGDEDYALFPENHRFQIPNGCHWRDIRARTTNVGQALQRALRYNRFLLDEVLSGRPQGSPLQPIVPQCLEHGEEGQQMLTALRDWWKTGVNDIGTPRPDTISPIPEGIPLLEAERIVREHEPGDGSPQKSVIQQIEAAMV